MKKKPAKQRREYVWVVEVRLKGGAWIPFGMKWFYYRSSALGELRRILSRHREWKRRDLRTKKYERREK